MAYISGAEKLERLRRAKENEPRNSSFVPTRHVKDLERSNFRRYIDDKQAAMVMFYDPECHHCHQSKPHFMKVAKELNARQRGFGSVDCSEEPALCEMEGVKQFPTFKLYVGGKFINSYNAPANAQDMITFVQNAPPAVEQPEYRETGGTSKRFYDHP